ncbi:MAG TPA: DUF2357 domain-containing protein [Pyrinomonadaceae bacterium]|nr:DUF2357 domain-containing protein [Pyrinomonadaceae bacterium]
MNDVFRIETDRTNLSLSEGSTPEYALSIQPAGRLAISPSTQTRNKLKIWRSGVPSEASENLAVELGPRLYEETSYSLLLSSSDKKLVELRHRDPTILQALHATNDGSIVHGTINFKSQIGRSRFSVYVDGKSEYDFEVEVFPSKLDYAADYHVLLADIQEILTGLVLEYLRSTFHLGFVADSDNPSRLEWILLLRHVVDDLERGLRYIEQHPHHGLTRERVSTLVEKLRRPDATISKMIQQGKGSGPKIRTASGIVLHSKLPEDRARTTLDTPEHRWLASQLTRIRRILAEIHLAERRRDASHDIRQLRILEEIENLEHRIAKLQNIDPIVQAKGLAPSGFTSLILQGRPGYREAFRACLILLQGLRVDGGPVGLLMKDTSHLYEYWCYLALVRMVARITGERIPVRELFSIEKSGLRVRLKRGTTQTVKFSNDDRSLELTYNPRYKDKAFIFPQPDVVLTFHDPQRPTLRVVFDAKYRIDPTAGYTKEFGSPGPPTEAIDVLHRYRDEFLQQTGLQGARSETLKQTVMEGVALFPYADLEDRFRNSRFWSSLEQFGIGAIPFLPRETRYLEEWLRTLLHRVGWSTTEKPIRYLSLEQERAWQQAEKEAVFIGTLRRNAIEHLKWVKQKRCYYTPLTPTQSRQLVTRWVAIYSPTSVRTPGAITHLAEVENYELRKRHDIDTLWPSQRNSDEMQVVYRLGEVRELERPIENRGPQGLNKRFSKNRWTTRLAIMRATELREILMETSAEWRLYEELRIAGATFTLKPGSTKLQDESDLRGRAWFVKPRLQVQYRGAAGFLIRRPGLRDEYLSDLDDVVAQFPSVHS